MRVISHALKSVKNVMFRLAVKYSQNQFRFKLSPCGDEYHDPQAINRIYYVIL